MKFIIISVFILGIDFFANVVFCENVSLGVVSAKPRCGSLTERRSPLRSEEKSATPDHPLMQRPGSTRATGGR